MKQLKPICRLLAGLTAATLALNVFAGGIGRGWSTYSIADNVLANTNTLTKSASGVLDTVRVIAPTDWTGTVTIATSHETLFTAAATTQTNTWRPRTIRHNNAGTAVTGVPTTNTPFVVDEQVTVTVSTTPADTTNTVVTEILFINP